MNKTEFGINSDHLSFNARVLDSGFGKMAKRILPEEVKRELRQIIYGEKARYPLSEPIVATLAGKKARFWIKNYSDWARIGTEDFEGNYSRLLIETLAQKDKPNFIDIGSAQGYYSIFAAKVDSNVTAIDPDPISQLSLKNNLLLNPELRDKIESIGIALGEKPGEMTLYVDVAGTHAPSLKRTIRGLNKVRTVSVKTLDSLVSDKKIMTPDVVKIDVEGAEGLVLNGMTAVLSSTNKPSDIFIELHPKYLPLFETSEAEVKDFIKKNGYILKNLWKRGNEVLCHFGL